MAKNETAQPREKHWREQMWSDTAKYHREKHEWVSAQLAADVEDALRFYRLHVENRDNPEWKP